MKLHIELRDEKGRLYRGTAELIGNAVGPSRRKTSATESVPPTTVIFTKNVKAFMKQHAKGKSGKAKFTLLLARLVSGKTGEPVAMDAVRVAWNRMTSILGGEFNTAYSNRALEEGWVDQPKYGTYALSADWKKSLD